MTRLNIPTGPPPKNDPRVLMSELGEAMQAWQFAIQTMAMAEQAVVASDTPSDMDTLRTSMWEACDAIDLAVDNLREKTRAVTEYQRREIRRARLAAPPRHQSDATE